MSFKIMFRALQSLNTHMADGILTALEARYQEKRNILLLSALEFLMNPIGYVPGRDGTLSRDGGAEADAASSIPEVI
jgi:hypothetical protein